MSKIMLVEDDNNLREIYEARLAAEGYEIVSAPDGEAALALGVKEKPDLIIADIMMPKVSGFDMLDIMRTTQETKNAKIIMMTALNQAEDKAKAERLGADLYLVKSQVTLEDVVRSAKKLLGEETPLNIGGVPVEHPEVNGVQPQNITSMTEPTAAVPQALNTPPPTMPSTPTTSTPNTGPSFQAPTTQTTTPTTPVEPSQPPQPSTTPIAEPVQAPQAVPKTAIEPPQPATPVAPQATPEIKEEKRDDPKINEASGNAVSKSSEEELLQKQIEQFITNDNPTISTDATTPTTPVKPSQPPQPSTTPIAEPVQAPQAVPKTAVEPPQPATPVAPQATPAPTMAAPPRDMSVNDPQTTALSDDKPAGERQIQKNSDGVAAEGGIAQNAEISGRKKVIKPISDVLTKGPDLNELLEKEKVTQPGTAPTVNSVVSPDGITSTPNQKSPIMSDVIAPNPSATPKLDPNNPPAPPVA